MGAMAGNDAWPGLDAGRPGFVVAWFMVLSGNPTLRPDVHGTEAAENVSNADC